MLRASIGLFLEDSRLAVVALVGRAQLTHFVVEDVEDPAAALDAELRARKLRAPRIRVGLDRRAVTVKELELPRGSGGDLGQMVGFELERHLPFAAEEVCFSWVELPSGVDEARRVLAAACGRRSLERPLGLLAGAKRRRAAITVASHELPALLAHGLLARRAIWAHRHGPRTDLLLLIGGTLLMSRSVAAADAEDLAREIGRSLSVAGLGPVRGCLGVGGRRSGLGLRSRAGAPPRCAGLHAALRGPPRRAGRRTAGGGLRRRPPGAGGGTAASPRRVRLAAHAVAALDPVAASARDGGHRARHRAARPDVRVHPRHGRRALPGAGDRGDPPARPRGEGGRCSGRRARPKPARSRRIGLRAPRRGSRRSRSCASSPRPSPQLRGSRS